MDNFPVLTPLLSLLRSRKFIAALVAFLASTFFYAFPQFYAFREIAVALIGALTFAVIGGIAYEDAAKAGEDLAAIDPESPEKDLRDLIEEVLDELLVIRTLPADDPPTL